MIIPACFSQPNSPSSSPNSQHPSQNLVTCIYQTLFCDSPTHLTLTWSKTPLSHSLTIYAADSFSITISLYPSTFSFFRTRPTSRSIYLTHQHRHNNKIKLYWDFARADFTHNSAEPDSGFYVAISCNTRLEFFLGDLQDELSRRTGLVIPARKIAEPTLLSRREHAFGRRSYVSRAEFLGSKHDIGIECSGGVLKVKVDGETRVVVKRLAWKFRGNERIFVGGTEVEFFWDVFNWVQNNNSNSHNKDKINSISNDNYGVFIFQIGEGGVWPEMVGPEKKLMKKSLSVSKPNNTSLSMSSSSPSCSSVLQWAEESSDGGRSSCSSSTRSSGSNGGFSLLLYAWRKD